MFNLKLTIFGAIFGLIISIFFGIMGGGIQFGVMMLRAFISSLLCGGILALASFIYRKFLLDSVGDLSSSENVTPTTGGMVDIRIDDDVLPDSDSAPEFYVTRKYGASQFDNSDYSSVDTSEDKQSVKESIEPQEKQKDNTLNSFSQKAADTSIGASAVSENQKSNNETQEFVPVTLAKEKFNSSNVSEPSISESLDNLPEFGSIIPDVNPQESEVIEDSAFAKGEDSPLSFSSDSMVGADTNLMAEAIKTLLKREG